MPATVQMSASIRITHRLPGERGGEREMRGNLDEAVVEMSVTDRGTGTRMALNRQDLQTV